MPLKHSTLRPGILVSLKTSITGNVTYEKRTIDDDAPVAGGAVVSKWETTRVIEDPMEHETAVQVRGRARKIISGRCAASGFGLLCPDDKSAELETALVEARTMIEEFNLQAKKTKIALFILTGRVSQDDVEAVRAINSEVRDLLDEMRNGISELDVDRVRAAATKAKGLGQMLTTDAQARIKEAIEAARASAKEIVKAGELASQEIDQQAIAAITRARHAFLDIEMDSSTEVMAPEATGRAIDMLPEETPYPGLEPDDESTIAVTVEPPVKAPKPKARKLEVD